MSRSSKSIKVHSLSVDYDAVCDEDDLVVRIFAEGYYGLVKLGAKNRVKWTFVEKFCCIFMTKTFGKKKIMYVKDCHMN